MLFTVKLFQHVSFEFLFIDVIKTKQLHDFEISKLSLKTKKTFLITKTTTKNWTCMILSSWNSLWMILSHSSISLTSSSEILSSSSISLKSLSETLSSSSILSRQISWNLSWMTLWHFSILLISNSLFTLKETENLKSMKQQLSYLYMFTLQSSTDILKWLSFLL